MGQVPSIKGHFGRAAALTEAPTSVGAVAECAEHARRILRARLSEYGLHWDPDAERLYGTALLQMEEGEAQQLFRDEAKQAGERVARWHRKREWAKGGAFFAAVGILVAFFSAATEQTHGWVRLVLFGIAFGLLFIPWWLGHLTHFIDSLIPPPE